MTSQLTYDKTTRVAFVDVHEMPKDAKIRVVSVSDLLGLRSEVRARYDAEHDVLLGLIIEDYPSFRREIMFKYVAFRIEKIVDLFVCSVKASLANDHSDRHSLVAV